MIIHSFDSNGGSAVGLVSKHRIIWNDTSAPTNPTREGYLFGGWYTSLP